MSDAYAGLINSAVVGVFYQAPGDWPEVDPEPEGFDPSTHTVVEVQAYLSEHPDETDTVLAAEAAGKNRTTLMEAS